MMTEEEAKATESSLRDLYKLALGTRNPRTIERVGKTYLEVARVAYPKGTSQNLLTTPGVPMFLRAPHDKRAKE